MISWCWLVVSTNYFSKIEFLHECMVIWWVNDVFIFDDIEDVIIKQQLALTGMIFCINRQMGS